MTPGEFIAKWRASELKERSAAQEHFIDLCRLLGEPTPAEADPTGERYCFERGARKDTGGDGWADVWKRHCFAWEYKGRHADLDAAFNQLRQYALALENPSLLIVSDMARFRIRTNWTNSVSLTHEFGLDDLADAATRDKLKWAMSDPDRLRPGESRQALTERAAATFAVLAQSLRERGHEPQAVAHFVNRLVFCMFAEDVGLLPADMFTRMLQQARKQPEEFAAMARALFGAMATGGLVGFEAAAWFNGGLFDDDAALPLAKSEIETTLEAAALDWSEIDPSILGTLFERGLDPDKRSQLGAHYTDRDKIMRIVEPVVVRPWLAEWQAVKAEIAGRLERAGAARSRSARTQQRGQAERRLRAFLERLREFTVLDPACGSGNFLYLALHALKDLEHRVQLEAEAMGLQRAFPAVGPANVRGIEINAYAAELARVSVWIGEIQWIRRNGFTESRDPILKPLETIECRDAILTPEGGEPEWPAADVVIGNPPFLGGKLLNTHLGEDYVSRIFKVYAGRVPAEADLVCYWFVKAGEQIEAGGAKRVGLVSTNSIRGEPTGVADRHRGPSHLRGVERRAVGDRRRGGARVPGVFRGAGGWIGAGAGTAARRRSRGCGPRRPDRAAGWCRRRPDRGAPSVPEHGRRVHGRHQGRPLRRAGRAGPGMAARARESERPAQLGRARAVDERHGRDASSLGQVDRGFRLGHGARGGGALRGAVPACEGARVSDAAAQPPRVVPRTLVAARGAAAGHVAGARRAVAVHRDAARGQAPAVRVARHAYPAGQPAHRHRARRRRDVRHPAQPVSRGVVVAARDVARQGQRPALHPDHDLRNLPVPGRPVAGRSGIRLRGRLAGRRHRRGRPAAGEPARPLAQSPRVGGVGRRAGARLSPAPRPPRRGGGEGAEEAHPDQPLQRPPAVA